jgi:type II restriction enzyme
VDTYAHTSTCQDGQLRTLTDVLNVVRALNKNKFVLQDVYAFAAHLAKLHPANRHVRDKIRQQLQVLRDLGFVEFLGAGQYRCV